VLLGGQVLLSSSHCCLIADVACRRLALKRLWDMLWCQLSLVQHLNIRCDPPSTCLVLHAAFTCCHCQSSGGTHICMLRLLLCRCGCPPYVQEDNINVVSARAASRRSCVGGPSWKGGPLPGWGPWSPMSSGSWTRTTGATSALAGSVARWPTCARVPV
jgi:hypothetical protein